MGVCSPATMCTPGSKLKTIKLGSRCLCPLSYLVSSPSWSSGSFLTSLLGTFEPQMGLESFSLDATLGRTD